MNIIRKYNLILLYLIISAVFSGCKKTADNPVDKDEVIVSPPNSLFHTVVPIKPFDLILTKPTSTSVTLSVLSYKTCDAKIEYYLYGSNDINIIEQSFKANQPEEILISGLVPNGTYIYYYLYKTSTSSQYIKSPVYTFRTAKKGDNPFVFAIQADSHLDMNTDTAIYLKTLENIAGDHPDFLIDLGDTYMNDKYGKDFSIALYNYIAQRYFLGSLCHSVPLFFVQGNHDGEAGMYYDGTSQSWAVWSNTLRKKYFPMPQPDNFYSGNIQTDVFCGYLQDYYAWEWSNSLFIVLDPFWYTPQSGQKDLWNRTLGKDQYKWLKNTLANSKAKFKFVFIHNLIGGVDIDGKGRGGTEVAGFYEWGGRSADSTYEFETRRPEWEMPVHQLLMKYGVNVVFHGHDHFFGYQQLDGIVYQELPQPSVNENFQPNQASGYGYFDGTILGGTGYLRVKIDGDEALIEFVSTHIKATQYNKEVVYSYIIKK